MIRVRVSRDARHRPLRLTVTGHADQMPYGQDIVCAAASALVETLVLGLTEVVDEPPGGAVAPGDADMTFFQPMSDQARAVVETIVRGFQDLADSEPQAVSFTDQRSGY